MDQWMKILSPIHVSIWETERTHKLSPGLYKHAVAYVYAPSSHVIILLSGQSMDAMDNLFLLGL